MRRKLRTVAIFCGVAGALWVGISASQQRATAPPEGRPYRIVDGKVDEMTYRGWEVFHSACHGCHGVDATGTSVAPNLVERIRAISERDFVNKVLTSYRIVAPSGDPSETREQIIDEVLRRERGELVMPAWEKTEVQPNVLDLYAYLRARGDGALGPGKPQRLTSGQHLDSTP
jgi:mono/diheme cytochrome c family protein